MGRNRLTALVTDEPVEFEKHSVPIQVFREITNHSTGIYRIYPHFNKEKAGRCQHVTCWTWRTLGFGLIVPRKFTRDTQTFRELTNHSTGIYGTYPQFNKETLPDVNNSTYCTWKTLGFGLIVPKNPTGTLKTSGKSPIIPWESIEYITIQPKKKLPDVNNLTYCTWKTLGFGLIVPKNPPGTLKTSGKSPIIP